MSARSHLITVTLVLLSVLLLPAAWAAPPLDMPPTGVLRASDGDSSHLFGQAIALQDDLAVIGAPGWNEAHGDNAGAVYFFSHDGQQWAERGQMLSSDARAYESYGASLALDGSTLVVGMPNAQRGNFGDPGFAFNVGAAYVYTGAGANWTEQAKLMPADLADLSWFGGPLDLDGDTLFIGAPSFDASAAEAVYAYQRSGATWGEPRKLSGPAGDHDFGMAVAVAGDVALVGAPGIRCCDQFAPFEKGVVYVYTRSSGLWSPAGSFMPDDGFPGDNFGCDIDFDGTTAVIAACQAMGLAEIHGYAYVFTRNGASWTQTARLEPEGDALFSLGIESVLLAGDRLLLGTTSAPDEPWPGRIYPYHRDGGMWMAETPIDPPDGLADTGFGEAMALNDHHFLAGASALPRDNVDEQGGVYTFAPADASTYTLFAPIIAAPRPPAGTGQIAFTARGAGGNTDIFVIRPEGTGKTNLTNTPQDESWPAWSPDGRRLAFSATLPSYQGVLVTTDAAGGDRKVIVEDSDLDFLSEATWSPDGARIAFSASSNDGGWDIYVVAAAGGPATNITPNLPGQNTSPAWSPDGRRILFTNVGVNSGDTRQLALVAPGGGAITFLTNDDRWHNYPDWSPDGTRILFAGGVNGVGHLFTMPAGGGQATPLISSAEMGRWSPTGSQIVFIGESGGLFRADADGSDISAVLPLTEGEVQNADWQP